jgi:hypothetical protein
MHTTAPRIAPIPPSEFTLEQSKLARVGTGRENLNLVQTMVNHPGVYDKFISFAEELVFNSQSGGARPRNPHLEDSFIVRGRI